MTLSTLQVQETPVSLFVKPTSIGSLKSDALLSAELRDSGICVTIGGSEESVNIITENSSPEKQGTELPFLYCLLLLTILVTDSS